MNFPSVTEVIKPWVDFSMIPPDVLDRASMKGVRVHTACAAIVRGFPATGLQDEDYGYVESFVKWLWATVSETILVEERLVHEALGFHGQPDLVVKARSGEVMLIDLKSTKMHPRTFLLQCAAYAFLVEHNYGIKVDKIGSLHLDANGKPPRMRWVEKSAEALAMFLQALNLHRYMAAKE